MTLILNVLILTTLILNVLENEKIYVVDSVS